MSESAADPLGWLTAEERNSYEVFLSRLRIAGSPTYPLAPETEVGLYQLFVNGRSLTEIHQANPAYNLGQLTYAAIHANWLDRKRDYLERLYSRVSARALQAAAEGVELAADVIAASRILHARKVGAFLKSGDDKDLLGVDVLSLSAVTKAADLMLKLTGQDRVQKHEHRGVVDHTVTPGVSVSPQRAGIIADKTSLLKQWAAEEAEKRPRGRTIDVE